MRGTTVRVWLVDDRRGESPNSLESLLKQLADRPESRVLVLGARPFWPELAAELSAHLPDVLLIHEPAWPDGPWTQQLQTGGAAVVVATAAERSARFRLLADVHPVWFLPAAPTPEGLWLALLGAAAAQRRHEHWTAQVARLQQRLSDRIIIERAKGILVQRLHINEEEAYKRLRVLSRRQRRQIRDIAQSLLDTQTLFLPEETNGLGELANPDGRPDPDKSLPQV